jgi:rod shape-determining protein MreC
MLSNIFRYWKSIVIGLLILGVLFLAVSGYLSSVIDQSLKPVISIESWFSTRIQLVTEFFSVPRDVSLLQQENAELAADNARLQTRVIELEQQLRESEVLYALLDFARAHPENVYVAAAVIGRDPSPFLHYVFIDQGSDDGLRYGMPVITENGLVGRIEAVTAGAARVQLITDPGSSINVMLQSSAKEGLMIGSITGDVSIDMIPQETIVQPGELVLTSGLGGNYPSDVLVGQIVSVRKTENELFQAAEVQPAVDFANLRALLVITNFKPVDITPLLPETNP